MKDHRLIDERSLAFDRLIAAKLRDESALLEKARGNLARWLETCSAGAKPALREWQQLLAGNFDELLALMEAKDERATRLRQSSPLCGILIPEERPGIIREFQAREPRNGDGVSTKSTKGHERKALRNFSDSPGG